MGVAEEAMIASVAEYGWRSLIVPWQANREKALEYNRIVLARLKRRVKLSSTSPSLCSEFMGNSDLSELIRPCNRAHRSRPTLEQGHPSSSAPRPHAADQSSGKKKTTKLEIMGRHR